MVMLMKQPIGLWYKWNGKAEASNALSTLLEITHELINMVFTGKRPVAMNSIIRGRP
jgi:hypothetical protein